MTRRQPRPLERPLDAYVRGFQDGVAVMKDVASRATALAIMDRGVESVALHGLWPSDYDTARDLQRVLADPPLRPLVAAQEKGETGS